jgi:hypothetical protein
MRVISKLRHIRDYVNELASSGRHSFTTADAQAWLQASPDATKLALWAEQVLDSDDPAVHMSA